VQLLRQRFEAPVDDPPDAFAALRHASSYSAALWPESSTLPTSLPAFVLPSHTLVPGETAEFLFFEPRYLELVRLALEENGGRFIHMPIRTDKNGKYGLGTLVTLVRHGKQDNGTIATQVVAGPRIEVTSHREQQVAASKGQLAAPAPLLHVEYAMRPDDQSEGPSKDGESVGSEGSYAEQNVAAARRCVELLLGFDADAGARLGRGVGLGVVPPFLCPERLSFFLCGALLANDDLHQRLAMLYCTRTAQRLDFCEAALNKRLKGGGEDDAEAERARDVAALSALHPAAGPDALAFDLGQCLLHRKYGYRGVVVGYDASCRQSDEWCRTMGIHTLHHGRDQPFYHVLVDVRDRPGGHISYVAQENISLDRPSEPLQHPGVTVPGLFERFDAARGKFEPSAELRDQFPPPPPAADEGAAGVDDDGEGT